jgi:serine/threonine protein kinase
MGQPADILSDFVGPDDLLADRFRIEHEVGSGAYGAIYLARDLQTGDELAVKALPPPGQGASETAVGRFERELKVVRNLQDPSIVRVVDYGETDDGVLYMVMEYIDGETLEREVQSEEGFEVDVALSVTRQIASALHTAHQSGVIHRDLKPANIMLTPSAAGYEVKVLDFGMAKLSARLGDESIVALTRDGMAVGTPRYIAPEQARGSPDIGPWTDVYALGLLLYEMLTGHKAVQHDSVESAVTEHVDSEPLELPGLEEFPDPVQELVRLMVRKDMSTRMQTADRVVERIDAMAETPFAALDTADSDEIVGPPMQADGSSDGPADPDRPRAASEAVAEAERGPTSEPTPAEDLDVDWSDRAPGESGSVPDRPRDPEGAGLEAWLGRVGLGVGAVVATGFVATASFMVIAAQARVLGHLASVALGGAPVVLAALSLFEGDRQTPGVQFLRNCIIYCGIGFVAAHLVGPMHLARQLWQDPVWFLEPFAALPGVGYLSTFLAWLGESYALLLVSMFGSGGGLGV